MLSVIEIGTGKFPLLKLELVDHFLENLIGS
jgi:hypothetical protein